MIYEINNFINKNKNLINKITNQWKKEKKKNLIKITNLLIAYSKISDDEQAQFTEVNNFILTYQEQFKIAEISKEITNQFKFYQNNLAQLNYKSSIVYDENSPIYLSFSVFNQSEESIW